MKTLTKNAWIGVLFCCMAIGCSDNTTSTNNRSNNPSPDMSDEASDSTGSPNGAACTVNSNCASEVCSDGTCTQDSTGPFCGRRYCVDGQKCEGGDCVADTACENPCGGVCCADTQSCMEGACVDVCEQGQSACDDGQGNIACCGSDQACLSNACKQLGNACVEPSNCPRGSYCEPTVNRCVEQTGPGTCTIGAGAEAFTPVIAFEWLGAPDEPYNQIMSSPMVGNLTDDNGDNLINEDDVPDIVFVTFNVSAYRSEGILRVISGDDGREHWNSQSVATPFFVYGSTTPALGDIDGDGILEIVIEAPNVIDSTTDPVSRSGGGVYAIEHDGAIKWHNIEAISSSGSGGAAIANVDGQGAPEIAVNRALISAAGDTICAPVAPSILPVFADVDLDGRQEILYGETVVKVNDTSVKDGSGCEIVEPAGQVYGGRIAVGNFDGDPNPEIVTVSPNGMLRLLNHDSTLIWERKMPLHMVRVQPLLDAAGVATCAEATGRLLTRTCNPAGGAPTIADFNGDGSPDIAVATRWYYLVYNAQGDVLWAFPSQDVSSAVTGSSVFDFEGDGKAEVVYNDELFLRVFKGAGKGVDEDGDGFNDAEILLEMENTSGTLFEYPLIVDVDNDNSAEIVVAANNYRYRANPDIDGNQGIRVLRDVQSRWVRTRRIWNQHTYHVTNINEDGTIPMVEPNNWQTPGLNNYRQNVQGDGLFNAPDLQIEVVSVQAANCAAGVDITLKLINAGDLGIRAGVVNVALSAGAPPVLIDTITNTEALPPGGSQTLTYTWTTPPAQLLGNNFDVRAVIDDDGMGVGRHTECDEDNNTAQKLMTLCDNPQ